LGYIEERGEALLKEAFMFKATDIHVLPRKHDAVIQFRIQDRLMFKETIALSVFEKLLSHFKFLAGMDIGEKRRPQNGAIQWMFNERNVSLRLSTLPTLHQESLVIRLLPQNNDIPLSKLSLFPKAAEILFNLSTRSAGLMILTGPTGSGKTTTLYSLIQAIQNTEHCNIITLEDPIEKQIDTCCLQVQVNEKAGITYAAGLKAILRHDPDIIMVGEIRDEETAKAAVRASLTGHLVLTTLHTKNAKSAINRLKDLGISIQDLEQTLLCVSAQRLVNLKCPFCKGPCSPYCLQLRQVNRLCIYELLYGENLKAAIREAKGEKVYYQYQTLEHLLNKGIALGYLSNESYGGKI